MKRFHTFNAAGEAVLIEPGRAFTTYWVIVQDQQEMAWSLRNIGDRVPCEVNHPWDALDRYTEADLHRFVISVEDIEPPAEDE